MPKKRFHTENVVHIKYNSLFKIVLLCEQAVTLKETLTDGELFRAADTEKKTPSD